jgi:hypothetical protein
MLTVAAIFEMMQAYKTTSLLCTGIELGLFDCLAEGRIDATTTAEKLGLNARATGLLLNALAAIGLLESDGHTYALDMGAAEYLVRGKPQFMGNMARVIASRWEWEALRRLPEAVRRGGTVMTENAETPEYAYWEDFAANAPAIARPTAEKVAEILGPLMATRSKMNILDLACGHGLYGFTLARHLPRARVWSLDWPNVLVVAERHAAHMCVAERVSMIAGDMFQVPLGGPYDVVVIANVLHHFSEKRGTELLRRAAAVTTPQGIVVLVGFVVDDQPPALNPAPHLFSILMLVWTTEGQAHSAVAYRRMLAAAGYENPALHGVPSLPMQIITASRSYQDQLRL